MKIKATMTFTEWIMQFKDSDYSCLGDLARTISKDRQWPRNTGYERSLLGIQHYMDNHPKAHPSVLKAFEYAWNQYFNSMKFAHDLSANDYLADFIPVSR